MKAIKIGTRVEIYSDTVMALNELPARACIMRSDKMAGFYLDEVHDIDPYYAFWQEH